MINENILKSCHSHGYNENEVYSAYKIFFGTLVSESRLKILNALREDKKNVTQIVKELNTDQTATSHDLKRLKNCGFVNTEVKGKYRYYSLNKKTIKPILESIDKHMKDHCLHILKSDKK